MKVLKGFIGGLFLSLLNAVFIIIVYLLVLGYLGYNLFILGAIGILFTPILFYRGYKLGYNFEYSNVKAPKLFKSFNFPQKLGIKEIAYLLIILAAITYLADRYTKPIMNFGSGIIDFVVPDCYDNQFLYPYGCETNAEREARYEKEAAEFKKWLELNEKNEAERQLIEEKFKLDWDNMLKENQRKNQELKEMLKTWEEKINNLD